MILKNLKKVFLLVIVLFSFFWFNSSSFSETTSTVPECSQNNLTPSQCVDYLNSKVADLKNQGNTLSSQISLMDNKIKLTGYQITATQNQITELSLDIDTTIKKISALQKSLDNSIEVLINRIIATYEVGTIQPLQILLTSGSASDFFTRLNYLKLAQAHDKKLIYDTQQAKADYANQKEIFEDKKKQIENLKSQLEAYSSQLDQEKANKQRLLAETKGSEAKFQSLLAQARAEYEAIQGIVAGKGSETEVGDVSEGSTIASVIQGQSCNSGGTHLHFITTKDGANQNPFNYLKSVSSENCSGSSCGSSDGDPFNPSGDWNWPLDPTIKMNQGYGSTWATKNSWVGKIYSFHNGIDIDGSSPSVKAVKSGKLYQGSFTGYAGCRLKYVKLVHNDNGFTTYYLHINYIF